MPQLINPSDTKTIDIVLNMLVDKELLETDEII